MNSTLKKDIIFLACLTAAVFLAVAFVSYSPFDPAAGIFAGYPANQPARNLGGPLGAFSAGWLLHLFGWPAYLLPVFLAVFAVRTYREAPPRFLRKALPLFLAIIAAGTLVGLLMPPGPGRAGAGEAFSFSPGGLAGYLLAEGARASLGQAGSLLVTVSLLVILISLALGISLLQLAREAAAGLWNACARGNAVTRAAPRKESPIVAAAPAAEPPPEEAPPAPGRGSSAFRLPGEDLLARPSAADNPVFDVERYKKVIEETIMDFGISVKVVEHSQGASVTMFEITLPPGVVPTRITGLADNLAMALRATSVRVIAPLPGKATVGLEVPNPEISTVCLSQVTGAPEFTRHRSRLALALGQDTMSKPLVGDLRAMPHLLIAGATNSGKSVCLNTILVSLLCRATPEEVQLLLVDPKKVELTPYNNLPHLLFPVITEARDAIDALKWMVGEMERRYRLFNQKEARSIDIYNARESERIPYIVIVIDELADLVTVARNEVESRIMRLSQLARAAGIHLIIATQRPSVNVITGVIKANLPARIAFQVSSKVDSRTILDAIGAEKLLGRGDMLYLSPAAMRPVRAQGCYISDPEIERICEFWKNQGSGPTHALEVLGEKDDNDPGESSDSEDPLYGEAVKIVTTHRNASVTYLQRRLKIGFNRAARLVEEMETEGIVGPHEEGKPRKVIR